MIRILLLVILLVVSWCSQEHVAPSEITLDSDRLRSTDDFMKIAERADL
jgi:hypothetical protein